MADDKKAHPAGPSGGDPKIEAKVKTGKSGSSKGAHGGAVGGSTATAPAGGRSR